MFIGIASSKGDPMLCAANCEKHNIPQPTITNKITVGCFNDSFIFFVSFKKLAEAK